MFSCLSSPPPPPLCHVCIVDVFLFGVESPGGMAPEADPAVQSQWAAAARSGLRSPLTSVARAAGLALLNKPIGLCARKRQPARVSSGPCKKRWAAPRGEPRPTLSGAPLRQRGHGSLSGSLWSETFWRGHFNIRFDCKCNKSPNI